MLTVSDIEKAANWSEPSEVQTKYGPRMLSKAAPTETFSALWKSQKDAVKALGAGFSKDMHDKWELVWWRKLDQAVVDERAQAVEQSRAACADIDLPCPDGLEYMPFQKAGIRYALERDNVLIADQMGLGKTPETIAVINADETIGSALIICPKSIKLNWLREVQRWLTRKLDVAIADKEWPETDIVIVHYEALGKFEPFIQFREWDVCVIDECHLIKSPKALRSKRAKAVKSRRKIRLTGTPIVNRPAELWNIIEDMTPIFGSYGKFVYRYANAYRTGFGINADGSSRLDELQRRLRETIMVRRTKDEVLTELPRKIRQIIEIEVETEAQRKAVGAESAYESTSENRLAELRALAELSKAEGEESYQEAVRRLKDASQVDFTEISRLRHETAVSKIPAVIEHVKSILVDGDDKVVVMIHHHDVADGIMDGLKAFNPVLLTGRNSIEERQRAIDAFQTDDSVRVFVGSIMAAGVGITLTAASIVVFAELDWVPGNISQAEDRLHRIGQLFAVLVQHIVLRGSIDARMAKVLVEKQRVIDDALDTEHEIKSAPVFEPKDRAATANVKTSDLDEIAAHISAEQRAILHIGLRHLAGMDTDHARELNDMGFSKIDVHIGHSLAEAERLSPRQAALAYKLLRKYHRQLSDEINGAIAAIDQSKKASGKK